MEPRSIISTLQAREAKAVKEADRLWCWEQEQAAGVAQQ